MPALVILAVSFITLRGAFPLDAYIIMNRLVPSDVQCTDSFVYLVLLGLFAASCTLRSCGVWYAAGCRFSLTLLVLLVLVCRVLRCIFRRLDNHHFCFKAQITTLAVRSMMIKHVSILLR